MNKAFHSSPALIVVLSLFSAGIAFAQSSDISPYSRYGIGDLQDQSSVLNSSMGGTGIAYHNDVSAPFFINLKNPASYAYNYVPIDDSAGTGGLKMATFEAGLLDNNMTLSSGGQTAGNSYASLYYIAMNMALSKHVGIALGLIPVSNEGYNISTTNNIDSNGNPNHSLGTVQNTYQGSGGINKVFLGAAYAPVKNLSFGVNLSYLFGNLTNEEQIIYPPNIAGFSTLKVENTGLHAFTADFGLMYSFKIAGDWSITLGATVAPSMPVAASYSVFLGTQDPSTGNVVDTLKDSSSNGKIRIPLMYGVGITIKEGDHWSFSFDKTIQNWGQYSYFGQTENLINSYTYGIGVQYIPQKDFPKTYFQRIHYRFGFSYSQNYLDLYNTPLIDKSFSAGIGLPIGASNPYTHPAVLNIGVQVGTMGTTTNNLILQNYVKMVVAFTFNDHWFDKRKFQ